MIDQQQNPQSSNAHNLQPRYAQVERGALGMQAQGRLDTSLNRLQQSTSALIVSNEQLERLADRLTGEVPTSASVSKLNGNPPATQSIAHAIDLACDQFEAQVSRQAVVLQRLSQL